MRKLIATTAAGLAIVTGSIAAAAISPFGTAFAQDSTDTTTQTQPEHRAGEGRKGRHHRLAKAAIKTSAEVIGLSPEDLATALKSGQSVAEVATANGVDPQSIIDKLVTNGSAAIDKAVQEDKLSEEQANEIKAKLPERASKFVNRQFDGSRRPGQNQGPNQPTN